MISATYDVLSLHDAVPPHTQALTSVFGAVEIALALRHCLLEFLIPFLLDQDKFGRLTMSPRLHQHTLDPNVY